MVPSRDRDNATYQADTAELFDAGGRLRTWQRDKYGPKSERLLKLGVRPADAVLDVGVGYGAWLSHLEGLGFANLFGMDPFEGSISLARQRSRAAFSPGRIEDADWPFDERKFAAVTSFDVIEHLAEPPVFFERAARYLRPGGVALVTTPLLELGYRCRKLPWIGEPDTNPTHINVHPPEYWLGLVRRSAFRLIEAWRGESLAHVRHLSRLGALLESLGVDHRRLPGVRQFEQSFCVALELR